MSIPITGLFAPSAGAGAFKLMLITDLDVGTLDKVMTLIAGGRITANGTAGEIVIQTTAGVPSHSATQGVLCWDSTNKHLYCNNNGTTGWTQIDILVVSDGDKGDITVSGSGTVWTIDAATITLAKMADMATASLIYRKTAGAGVPEVNTLATLKTDLGLTGTNSGDQTTIVGITGTKAQFDTAVTDGNILYVGDAYVPSGTDVAIADGGTGQSTAQLAINALTAVSGATNEHVLTKDTATGNAIFKAGGAGGVPTTITVADTTDTTSFVALFESATGDLGPKTDAGATYNATTGMLTVTGITAPHTGDTNLTTAPGSDHTASGIKLTLAANENQAFGDVCYIASDGQAQLGDADAIATAGVCVMCCDATISANATGNYLMLGIARDDTWAWTVGGFIYLSTTGTTGNTLTQTQPSGANDIIQIIGVATHADRILFNPNLTTVEHT